MSSPDNYFAIHFTKGPTTHSIRSHDLVWMVSSQYEATLVTIKALVESLGASGYAVSVYNYMEGSTPHQVTDQFLQGDNS